MEIKRVSSASEPPGQVAFECLCHQKAASVDSDLGSVISAWILPKPPRSPAWTSPRLPSEKQGLTLAGLESVRYAKHAMRAKYAGRSKECTLCLYREARNT